MTKDMVRLLKQANISLLEQAEANKIWQEFREANGLAGHPKMLTTDEDNMKLGKSAKIGIPTLGLSLSPATHSGEFNVCRYATACADSCVAFAGNGLYPKIQRARDVKTKFLAHNASAMLTLIVHEIDKAVEKHGQVAVRMNTFSDIPWEQIIPWLFDRWGDKVTFYDYTKWPRSERPEVPGYDLTRSATERHTDEDIVGMLKAGDRVAVCADYKKAETPTTYLGFPVVDGDKHDARFTEDKGVVVLLRPKGHARRNNWIRRRDNA